MPFNPDFDSDEKLITMTLAMLFVELQKDISPKAPKRVQTANCRRAEDTSQNT